MNLGVNMGIEEVKEKLRGPVVSMPTPMKQNYDIDLKGLKANAHFIIEKGLKGNGVLMAVTAGGECFSLSIEERKMAMKAVAEEAKGKVPLITSAQDCNIDVVVELSNYAKSVGYDVIQISQPYYTGTSAGELYQWFKKICEKTEIGIMVYNTPWLSGGFSIGIELMGKLIELDNIISFKWSSPDSYTYMEGYKKYAEKLPILANDAVPIVAHMLGAKMFLAIPGNYAPQYVVEIWNLLEEQRYLEALKELWRFTIPWYQWLRQLGDEGVHEYFTKATLEMLGLAAGPSKPPFDHKLNADQEKRLREILVNAGLNVIK
jgi:dihydrodipicolinate synthase/N-acetylneuraminate lyase